MRAYTLIFILISLLVLVGTVGAVGIPDTIIVNSNTPWLIANNVSQSVITVTVLNTTSGYEGPVPGVTVNLAVDPLYGTLSPILITTNPSGMASSTFKVKTRSGAPEITATISTTTISNSTIQNIDHDTPYYDPSYSPLLFTYPSQGIVATEIPFKISMFDRWGNPIDDRRGNHTLSLHVTSPLIPDNCGFNDGGIYKHDLSLPLEADGTLSVNVRLTTKTGLNYVRMDSIGDINFKTVSIKAVAGDMPFSMTGSISHGGILSVGTQRFTIDYYLYDFYQNPMANKSIWINTNLSGETTPQLYTSDDNGLIRFYYGPKISIITAKITAVTQNNASVTNELIANFVSNDIPTNLILVVTPETMASRETDPSTVREARVLGILTDDFGNPINGQDITFTISDITTAPYNTTGSPSFESGSLVKSRTTDSYGNAITTFYPGSFVTEGEDGYSNSATGSCKISATSGSLTSNPVIVEWKNFAYLSVTVAAQPSTVLVNETIDVIIKVTGDGYKMVHNPITVMLDMDTTSNLNAVAAGDKVSEGGNGLKRFPNSKIAAESFVGSLSSQDQLGLVTYGYYPNSQYWELISDASYNHNQVNSSIESLEESGGLNVSIRDSIHEAVTRITTNPTRPTEEVAAIITIGDSSYQAGDFAPMVQETWTDNHIRVYSILYVSSLNNCDGNYAQDLTALTTATHGKFYCNDNLESVIESFADIKQNLSTLAGVNTSMDLDFEHVTVDSNPMDGNDVFSYVVVDNGMTSPDSRTTILWPNQTRSFENQTDDWNDDFHLNFTIGTIHIKESWETTFRYKVKQEGIIDLFGPGSTISYNGGTGNLKLPTTLITSINNTIPQGLQSGTLSITNLVPKSGNYTDYVPMQWKLNYTGFDTVTEKYWYSYNNQPWVEFGSIPNIPSTNGMEILRSSDLDVTKFPPGKYRLMVTAQVPGIPLEMDDSGAFIKPGADPKINIRLK